MKRKAISVFLILLLVLTLLSTAFLLLHVNRLQNLVDKQNVILENYSEIDSMINSGESDLIVAINNFLKDVPTDSNGKKLTPMDYVLYTKRLSDSLEIYKWKYDYAKNTYGFDIIYSQTDSTRTIRPKFGTKADSAGVLLEYFGDRLKRTPRGWEINTTSYEGIYKSTFSELNELKNDYNRLSETHNKTLEKYQSWMRKFEEEGLIEIDTIGQDSIVIRY